MKRSRLTGKGTTVLLAASSLLIMASSHWAAGQDEDNSRAVRIIDGATPSTSPPPVNPSAAGSSPNVLDQRKGELPPAPSPLPKASSPTLTTAPLVGTALPTEPANPNPAAIALPMLPNSAGLSIEMLPDTTAPVGSRVSFRIASKKAGYLILVDVDANGKLTQIYPNPASLIEGIGKPTSNFLRPNRPVQIPSPIPPYAGFEFIVSPPVGSAMVVAILSDRPVQMVDLPDIPSSLVGRGEAADFVSKIAKELRIPAARVENSLQQPTWSLSAKFYEIKNVAD